MGRVRLPSTAAELDAAEAELQAALGEQALDRAATAYFVGLGGYRHLAWRLGEYTRGLRVSSKLCDAGARAPFAQGERVEQEHAMFRLALGDILGAHEELCALRDQAPPERYDATATKFDGVAYRCWIAPLRLMSADALVALGRLPEAARHIVETFGASGPFSPAYGYSFHVNASPFARRGWVRFLVGRIDEARADFAAAFEQTAWLSDPFEPWVRRLHTGPYHFELVWADALVRLGQVREAAQILDRFGHVPPENLPPLTTAHRALSRAELLRCTGRADEALAHTAMASAWAEQSSHAETQARVALVRARIQLQLGHEQEARTAIDAALQIAGRCHFGLTGIDALIVDGHIALRAGDATRAAALGDAARAASSHEDCGYAWGVGDGAHLAARAKLVLGQRDDAIAAAKDAWHVRTALNDPRLRTTRRLFEELGASPPAE
jgi:tetratricopeptide (TPR) repeat protein